MFPRNGETGFDEKKPVYLSLKFADMNLLSTWKIGILFIMRYIHYVTYNGMNIITRSGGGYMVSLNGRVDDKRQNLGIFKQNDVSFEWLFLDMNKY